MADGGQLERRQLKEDKAARAARATATPITGSAGVRGAEANFTKSISDIVATEEASAGEYDRQTKENEILKTTVEQDVKCKSKKILKTTVEQDVKCSILKELDESRGSHAEPEARPPSAFAGSF